MEKGMNDEKILGKIRAVEVEVSGGLSIKAACRKIGMSDSTYYKWRNRFGGVDRSGIKRIKDLEKENDRLRKVVLDLQLEKQVLKESNDFFLGKQRQKKDANV